MLTGHVRCVNSVSFARRFKGRQLLASAADDGTVRIWNCDTGECVHVLKAHLHHFVTFAIFLPNVDKNNNACLQLASASFDKTIRIWNGETGECNQILQGHDGAVWCLSACTSVSGNVLLASGSADGTVRVWNVATGACLHVLRDEIYRVQFAAYSVAFSADGQRVVAGSPNAARVWDVATQKIMSTKVSTESVTGVAWSANNLNLIAGTISRCGDLWNAETGVSVRIDTRDVAWVTFSPDGKHFASGKHTVHVWVLLNYHQLAIFLLLLRVNVAPYVMLDIVDLLLAHEEKHSVANESNFMHFAKICFINAVRQRRNSCRGSIVDPLQATGPIYVESLRQLQQ